MSLFANRRIEASHIRPTTTPGDRTRRTSLGTVWIGFGEEAFVQQADDALGAPTAEFPIFINPDDDIQMGDLLRFESPIDGVTYEHEVSTIRRFPSGKRVDNAEALVFRKELIR